MPADINIHNAHDARVRSFTPDNNFALGLVVGGNELTLFGMDPVLAWALFDLMRDGRTRFHFRDETISRIGEDPQASADLIRRAREETLPHADPEDDPVDTLRAFVSGAV
jgi:hypothetical protein